MSAAVEGLERADALRQSKPNKQSGLAPSKVEIPPFRDPWVCKRIFDVNGEEVDFADRRHPCRSVEVGEAHPDGVEATSDSEDELILDFGR